MKTASAELKALLAGNNQFTVTDLLTITLRDGTQIRLTDWHNGIFPDLISNGSARAGDASNFAGMTYDAADGMTLIGCLTASTGTIFSTEYIAVDTASTYALEAAFKASNRATLHSVGFACYDSAKVLIPIQNTYTIPGCKVFFYAAALAGATTFQVQKPSVAWAAPGNSFALPGINAANSNLPISALTVTAIDTSNPLYNLITVSAGLPSNASTADYVSNSKGGSAHNYALASAQPSNGIWERKSALIFGLNDAYLAPIATNFLRGTVYVRMVFLINTNAVASTSWRYDDISLTKNSERKPYTPTVFTRGKTRVVAGLEVDTLDITLNPSTLDRIKSIPTVKFAHDGGFDGAQFTLEKLFILDASGGYYASLFTGASLSLIKTGQCLVDANYEPYKNGGVSAWDSSVYTPGAQYGQAYLSYKCSQTNADIMVGFSTSPVQGSNTASVDSNYASLDYAIYHRADGQIEVFHSGVPMGFFGTYATTDAFSMTYDGVSVKYYKNAVVFFSTVVESTTPVALESAFYQAELSDYDRITGMSSPGRSAALYIYLDTSFYTPNGRINSLVFGPYSLIDGNFGALVPVGAVNLFTGEVAECDPSGTEIRLQIKSSLARLNIKMPRQTYQSSCLNSVYDTACGLSKAVFTSSSAVNSGSTSSVINCGLVASGSYYEQGTITFTSGVNVGQSFTVKKYTTGVITLMRSALIAPAVGDTFTASAGCDRTKTICTSRFNNLPRLRSMPYIPAPETAY